MSVKKLLQKVLDKLFRKKEVGEFTIMIDFDKYLQIREVKPGYLEPGCLKPALPFAEEQMKDPGPREK